MESPFKDMLHSNVVPSDSECQRIRDLLAGSQKQFDELTEELARLDTMRNEISGKQRDLQQFIDMHQALVSPARRLPEDVLRSIFMACLPPTRNPAIIGQEAPFLLCQICRAWRSVALATPRLWAAIHIVVPPNSLVQQVIDQVVIWLYRSGAVPLHISIVLSSSCDFTSNNDISPLLSALVAVSRRWKTIEMLLPGNFLAASPLRSLTAEAVPFLETVQIGEGGLHTTIPMGGQWDSTTITPVDGATLKFLATRSLRNLKFSGRVHKAPVFWDYLTCLSIAGSTQGIITGSEALTILQQCTSLQSCELRIIDFMPADQLAPVNSFSLPHLTHLSIASHTSFQREHLFGIMSLPNLRSLVLTFGGVLETNVRQLLPSTPSLEFLQATGLESTALLDILSSTPTLVKLVVSQEPRTVLDPANQSDWNLFPDPNFLTRLTPRLGPLVCPLLDSVQLLGFNAASDEAVLQFVLSRTTAKIDAVARLAHLEVVFSRLMSFDIMPRLKDAIAGGLDISINYPSRARPNQTQNAMTYSPLEGTSSVSPWAYEQQVL
ncbi:hypothetical protein DFH06DRAFT_283797 [Mycena polygramma]|nr:hypothetical protein DFH06DRAFT_283797 [Mycena polygramma]